MQEKKIGSVGRECEFKPLASATVLMAVSGLGLLKSQAEVACSQMDSPNTQMKIHYMTVHRELETRRMKTHTSERGLTLEQPCLSSCTDMAECFYDSRATT